MAANVSPQTDPIPLVADVDLLIVGGSSSAVAAALAAAARGLSVFLAAPRPYLGDDIAAPFDYWPRPDDELDTDLARTLFPKFPDAPGAPPTPMHVKQTLEQALVAANVPFLLNTHPAGVLRDAANRLRGTVLANRTGRLAVSAATVIDATERALVAGPAGSAVTPPPPGPQAVSHVTTGGAPADGSDLTVEALPPMRALSGGDYLPIPARRYRLTVDLGTGDPAARSAAYAEVLRRCASPGMFQHAERLALDATDRVAGDHRVSEWPTAARFPLDALRVEDGLHVLGRCAPVSDAVAAKLARPAHGMTLGQRIGESIEPARAPRAGDLRVELAGSVPVPEGEVRTLLHGLRPTDVPQRTVPAPANAFPRLGTYDVAVVGGGTGGAPAAIAAARAGASTLLCENLYALGGVGTVGQICVYYYGNQVGFTAEVDASVSALESDPALRDDPRRWSRIAKQAWYLSEARRASADVRFATVCCGAWVVDGTLRGVLIAGPDGIGLVEARTVIDATGSADVAAAAGAPTRTIDASHVAVQGVGLAAVHPLAVVRNSDHTFSDDSDALDATAMLVTTKRKFPGEFDLAQLIDSRERRQIVGDLSLTPADFLTDRRFPDSICLASSNFDTHGYTVHPLFTAKPPNKERMWVYVPYRCLLPQGLDGLLVTGLGVSAHRDALPVIRMQADVQNQGYAAGYAAALAARSRTTVRRIDVGELQHHLVEIGCLPESVLSDQDTFPPTDRALQDAVDSGWDAYRGLALCFEHFDRAQPLLRQAYAQASEPARKLRYALVLGLMGDATGADTLAREVASRTWDAGWNYRGMHQFGMSVSELDALLLALGRCGDPAAWDVLLAQAGTLLTTAPAPAVPASNAPPAAPAPASSASASAAAASAGSPASASSAPAGASAPPASAEPDFSHCRALAESFESLYARHPNASAARALADILRAPGVQGHALTTLHALQERLDLDACNNILRNRALRELHLARAIFRCGDENGLGRSTLLAYAADLRGPFSRHARAVLAQPCPAAGPT